jgi:multidrug efflux pump subunit AcrA (membrane-fusion protein)
LAILFLPWTQNIRSRGKVTTLRQEQRPQQLNTIIPGKVFKWHVKEGDFVKKGDTLLQLSEIKDDYLDPQLLNRTQEQLDAKKSTVDFYKGKVGATDQQITALEAELVLKLEQTQNKITQQKRKIESDSLDLIAATNELTVAKRQLDAAKNMLDSGVISLVDFERRKVSFQNFQAKKISADNKLANSRQDLIIQRIELNSLGQEYAEKISKARGDKFSVLSQITTGEGEVAKLENQYMNYNIRSGLYYITAPQDGQVVRAKKAGLGEILKEGEMIVEIVPGNVDLAVEMFVKPVDLPLLSPGQKVRFMFDGFPAIVFSGWPETSYGTFGGTVTAVENSVSPNGLFRVLVKEDKSDRPWPKQLMMGTGAMGMALLKDVPIWYELWRNINGFPPEYYLSGDEKSVSQKEKK